METGPVLTVSDHLQVQHWQQLGMKELDSVLRAARLVGKSDWRLENIESDRVSWEY